MCVCVSKREGKEERKEMKESRSMSPTVFGFVSCRPVRFIFMLKYSLVSVTNDGDATVSK